MSERPIIDHIGIIVEKLENAVVSMEKFLGVSPEPVEEMPNAGIRVAAFKAANIVIELIEYLSEGKSLGRATMGDRPGLNHLSKRVDDIDRAIERLTGDGFNMVPGFPVDGVSGAVAFFTADPANAVLMEICQPRKRAGQ